MTQAVTKFGSSPIEALLAQCHCRTFAPKAIVIRQGDPAGELYYIIRGSVTVMLQDEKGHEIVLAYLGSGEFIGELGLFNEDHSRTALVRAKTQAEIAQISYRKLRGMTDLYPAIIASMTEQLARRLMKTNQKLGDLAFMDVYGRVARTLLEMSKQPEAIIHPAGAQIRITRQELARLVGCSREMVGKVIKDMEHRNAVEIDGRNIVVLGMGSQTGS